MPRAKVAIGKPAMNDPSNTNTADHTRKVIFQLMEDLDEVRAADIALFDLSNLKDDGLTATIDKLADIQKTLVEERAILRVKSRQTKTSEEGSAASSDGEFETFKRTVQKHYPNAVFDKDITHARRWYGFRTNDDLDECLGTAVKRAFSDIGRYNISRHYGVWNLVF